MTRSPSERTLSPETAKAAFEAYSACNRTLRAWLGTYSVGVPAFLFSKSAVVDKLIAHHAAYRIGALFAAAIGLQVAITFFNKYTQWGVYASHTDPPIIGPIADWCEEVSEWILIDLCMDAGTILLLALGTFQVFITLVGR